MEGEHAFDLQRNVYSSLKQLYTATDGASPELSSSGPCSILGIRLKKEAGGLGLCKGCVLRCFVSYSKVLVESCFWEFGGRKEGVAVLG